MIKHHPGKSAWSGRPDDDADLYVRPFSITLLALVSLAVAAGVGLIILLLG